MRNLRQVRQVRQAALSLCLFLCLLAMGGRAARAQAVYVPSKTSDITGLDQRLSGPQFLGYSNRLDADVGGDGNGYSSRLTFIIRRAAWDIRVVYYNPSQNTNTQTTRCALEVPAASSPTGATIYYPFTFNGNRDITYSPGAWVTSDPLSVNLTPGQVVYVRSLMTCPAGGKISFGRYMSDNMGEGVVSGSSDLTTSGTITPVFTYGTGPMALVGTTRTPAPVVALIGDSWLFASGYAGYSITTPAGSDKSSGYGQQALLNMSFVTIAAAGESAAGFLTNLPKKLFLTGFGCTSALVEHGINDIGGTVNTTDGPALQSNILKISQLLATRGMAVFIQTVAPRNTSTDGWATTTNQTKNPNDAQRVLYNNWIRDGAPVTSASNLTAVATGTVNALRMGQAGHPMAGYFDGADALETARDSGIWKAAYTNDGVHPRSVAAQNALAATIDTTKFK